MSFTAKKVATIYAKDPNVNSYRARRLDLLEQFFNYQYYQRPTTASFSTSQKAWEGTVGSWQPNVNCPLGQFVTGANAQIDLTANNGDSLVGLYVTCNSFPKLVIGAIDLDVRIQNLEYLAGTVLGTSFIGGTDTYVVNSGGQGIWKGEKICAPGEYVCGFETQSLEGEIEGITGLISVCCVFPSVEIDTTAGPDERLTALENYAKTLATLPPTLSLAYTHGFPEAATGSGKWRGEVLCPDGQFVCGVQAQYQPTGVDSGINGLNEMCCAFGVYKTAATPAPTLSPTPVPTLEPTPSPSESPSPAPTKEPIADPTAAPTSPPTDVPISVPTPSPTPLPTDEPTRKPIVSPTWSPVALPTEQPTDSPVALPTPVPTASPTYKTDPLFCPFTYVKGDYNRAPEGCTLFAKNDIGWDKFESSPAFYLCSTSSASPTKVNSQVFLGYGITDSSSKNPTKGLDAVGLSIIKPGKDNSVTFFSGNNFDGMKATFTPKVTHTLDHYDFPSSGGQKTNDAIRSVVVYSTADQIPKSCKDLFNHLKK